MKTSCSHLLRRVVGTLVSLTLVVMVAMPAQAQDTASQIRGRILDSSGDAVSGANVVVTDTRTSVDRNYISSSSGTFLATGLPVGGPYRITINNVKTIDVPSIDLGDTYNLTINLQEDVAIEEIITIGQTADFVDTAPGPAPEQSRSPPNPRQLPRTAQGRPHDRRQPPQAWHRRWQR